MKHIASGRKPRVFGSWLECKYGFSSVCGCDFPLFMFKHGPLMGSQADGTGNGIWDRDRFVIDSVLSLLRESYRVLI